MTNHAYKFAILNNGCFQAREGDIRTLFYGGEASPPTGGIADVEDVPWQQGG